MDRLARIVGRIRRALALAIVGTIAGALIVELWHRVYAELWIRTTPPPIVRRPRTGGRSPGQPDWYEARRLATEAEHYAEHPIRLETFDARPAEPAR